MSWALRWQTPSGTTSKAETIAGHPEESPVTGPVIGVDSQQKKMAQRCNWGRLFFAVEWTN